MQRQYRTRKRIRRKSKSADELLSATHTTNADNILHLQRILGNQAVLQMMGEQETEKPSSNNHASFGDAFKIQSPSPAKISEPNSQPLINVGSFTIQRMPQVAEAEAMLPNSDAKDMKRRRGLIINMIRKVHQKVQDYPQGFPDSADAIRNGLADQYLNDQANDLKVLSKGIHGALAKMKEYFQQRQASKTFGKDKHATRVRQINRFARQVEKANSIKQVLYEVHHATVNAVMSGADDLDYLTADDIVGDVNDNAAQGGVHTLGKGQMQTSQGIKTGYMKSDEASPDDAGNAIHIEGYSGNQGLRAVATYDISELLGMGIIPYTALTKGQDEKGNVTTGQFMEEAEGFTGRGKILSDEIPTQEAEKVRALLEELKNPDITSRRKGDIDNEMADILGNYGAAMGTKEVDGKMYQLDMAIADIDWMTPVIQKDLSTLQLFDMIVAHADRHPENYVIETDKSGTMTGVKGIDNDSVWGKRADADFMQDEGDFGWKAKTKTPGLPPVIDAEVALRVVQTPWQSVEAVLVKYAMNGEEIDAAHSRWDYIQGKVKEMILAGNLATMDMAEVDQGILYLHLYSAIGEVAPLDILGRGMMSWGEDTEELMSGENSYAGREMNAENKVNPEDYVH